LEAFYRFINNSTVNIDRLLAEHVAKSVERCSKFGDVIAIHDTSEFRFNGEGERRGLGMVSDGARGFFGHFAIAISADGYRIPLGLVGLELIYRPDDPVKARMTKRQRRHDPERESLKWRDVVVQSNELLRPVAKAVHVMDREADDYMLLWTMDSGGISFVVRIKSDRIVDCRKSGPHLMEKCSHVEGICEREVHLGKRSGKRSGTEKRNFPDRDERVTRLLYSAMPVKIFKPVDVKEVCDKELVLNVVHVWEPDPPDGEEAVEWFLYTNLPVSCAEDVLKVVDIYRARWTIEEFFKALKTGCAFEKRQLESSDSIEAALGLFLPVAWHLLLVRAVSRTAPEAPPSTVFSPAQLKILEQTQPTYRRAKNRTLHLAILAVAAMGGHIKNNGPPGWIVLGRGFQALHAYEAGWLAAVEAYGFT
jgi:hypothetical protein